MPITYKCPGCGSSMEFDSVSQMLKCTSCDMEIKVEDYQRQYQQQHEDYKQNNQSENGQTQSQMSDNSGNGMKVFHCQNCGAELVADENTSATICSFCGNPSLVEERLSGEFKPEFVIPFKFDKNNAKEKYIGWTKKGLLTPSDMRSTSTVEKITGVYVPFWLYDYKANTQMNASAERVRRERRGDTEYIYTDHFRLYRNIDAQFEKIPADASEKMEDDVMDKLEPFEYSELVPFSMPYLSGYLSEKYNYTADEMKGRVDTRVDQYITDIGRSTMTGYSNVMVTNNNISKNNFNHAYALFPVWMLNYRYRGKDYKFVLNGQTGKIVADRPISKAKAAVSGCVIFAAVFILSMFTGFFM